MIGTGNPNGALSAHTVVAHEHVLHRVFKSVAQMERAGHIGRGKDDRELFGV